MRITDLPTPNEFLFSPNGELLEAGISGTFSLREGMVESPMLVLFLPEGKNGLRKEDWELELDCLEDQSSRGFTYEKNSGDTGYLIFVDSKGGKFVNDWAVEMVQEREGQQSYFLVLTQTYFGKGEFEQGKEPKIFLSPLRINMSEVEKAVLSQPPYPKDERGRLVVSWRNIDRIVGASLSYSYPPPTSQK